MVSGSDFFNFETIGAKKYANISHGLHEKLVFIAFFMLSGIMSTLHNKRITLTKMITRIHSQNELHNNNVQNIKQVRNNIDSFNRRYGIE